VWSSGENQRIDMLALPIERPGAATTSVRIGSTEPASPVAAPFVFGITVSDSEDCNGDGTADWGQCLNGTLPDTNTNGVPDGCECAAFPTSPACCTGNLNGDAAVDGADLGILLFAWGPVTASPAADLNADGQVDGADLGVVLSHWGACP